MAVSYKKFISFIDRKRYDKRTITTESRIFSQYYYTTKTEWICFS